MSDNNRDLRLVDEFPIPTFKEWRSEVERLLKGAAFDKRMLTRTHEGITLQPIYRREDIKDLPHVDSLPGEAPYVRGGECFRDPQQAWEVTEEISAPTYEKFNGALRGDLKRGLTSVRIALDEASRQGLDPDEAESAQVGHGGVSIASIRGFARALDHIDLAKTPVYIRSGSAGLPFLGIYVAVAGSHGVGPEQLPGAVAMDPLGDLAITGHLPTSLGTACKEMAAITGWAAERAPKLGTIWVHGEPYSNAGGNAVQELAFVIATAVEYLRELEMRTIAPESAAPHFRFSFAAGSNFFMEVAKLRAARLLWNRVLETCGVDENHRHMWMHVRTARYSKTLFDPYVNMLRAATEAFSGAVGGADSLQVAPFDESFRTADEFSRRIARNSQIIIRDEVHLGQVMDPAGGSYYVEKLTAEIAEAAWTLMQQVEGKGGMSRALGEGFPQGEVTRSATDRAEAYALRKNVQVGTNKYPNPTEERLATVDVDHGEIHEVRSRRIKELRSLPEHKEALAAVKDLAEIVETGSGGLVDAVIKAAGKGGTIGEITHALRASEAATTEVKPLKVERAAAQFEALRLAIMNQRKSKGGLKVYMTTLGPAGHYMPRLDFAASFFEVGGFEVIRTTGHDSADEAAAEALKADADVAVICGLDEAYTESAPAVAKAIKKSRPHTIVVLAGKPAEETVAALWHEAGIETFIHIRSNVLAVLTSIASKLGVQL